MEKIISKWNVDFVDIYMAELEKDGIVSQSFYMHVLMAYVEKFDI